MSGTVVTARIEPRVSQLVALANRGLKSMYDEEKKLFCYRFRRTASGFAREGVSQRYTTMVLLGLLRANAVGLQPCIDVRASLDSLFADISWVNNIGDLGLLLWLSASFSREYLNRFCSKFNLEQALKGYSGAHERLTMELSWFLTGLAYCREAGPEQSPGLADVASRTYEVVCANQGDDGLFAHMATWGSLTGVVRGRIGSFADQVYPIYALAQYAHVFRATEPLEKAVRCANAICRLQGPLGQWWWHYDSMTGRVIERYPVYSVHQHAMAPMALFALQNTSNANFDEHIYKGLEWINGANELQEDLEDTATGVIWRCIRRHKSASYIAPIRAVLGRAPKSSAMETLYECRPYELGWLIYAHAQPASKPMSA
jgi:hypothetical protein